MSDAISDFLQELQKDGALSETAAGFTLQADRAREKLKKFALAHPESYFLLIVGALFTLGGRQFQLRVDSDDLVLESDAGLARSLTGDLWSRLASSSKDPQDQAMRLLAMSILTSSRFEAVDWELIAEDSEGGFSYSQAIRDGEILDPKLLSAELERPGVTVKVKRRKLGQVARRFISYLKSRLFESEMLEKEVLLERVFLGAFTSFSFNDTPLDCVTRESVLATWAGGRSADFLKADHRYEASSDVPLVAVITELSSVAELPGAPRKIAWLWHGLKMGESELNLPYEFCRAFVFADHLSPDLGLTAIPDSWDKNRSERAARNAVRDALHALTLEYLAHQKSDQEASWDLRVERILLRVLADRIQVNKAPNRLAKFNRDLVACPLFWGSDADGKEKRFTFAELWERFRSGLAMAAFRAEDEPFSVPPWPDRPLVLLGDAHVVTALRAMFGKDSLQNAAVVAKKIRRLLRVIEGSASGGLLRQNDEISGEFDWQGVRATWSVERNPSSMISGEVLVYKDGAYFFRDSGLGLPPRLRVQGEFPWTPSYNGRLRDRDTGVALAREALESIAEFLANRTGPPSADDLILSRVLWKAVGVENPVFAHRFPASKKSWVLVYLPQVGWTKESPQRLFQESSIPLYWHDFENASSFEAPLQSVSFLFVDRESVRTIRKWSKRPIISATTISRFLAQKRLELSPDDYRIVSLTTDGRIATVGFPKSGVSQRPELTLHFNVGEHSIKPRAVSSFIKPLVVIVEVEEGLPTAKLDDFSDRDLVGSIEKGLPDLVRRAARDLIEDLPLEEASTLDADTLTSAWFECFTDSRYRDEKIFWTGSERRTSASEVLKLDRVAYFTEPSSPRHQERSDLLLWVPAQTVETLEMVDSEVEWYPVAELPVASLPVDESLIPFPSKNPVRKPLPAEKVLLREESKSEIPVELSVSVDSRVDSPDESNPKAVLLDDETLKNKPPQVSEMVVARPVSELRLPFYHRALIEQFQALSLDRENEAWIEFENYLGELTWTSQGTDWIEQGRLSLAALGGETRVSEPQTCIYLLSALFSRFNREREEIEDGHERAFHRALLSRCEELFTKGPISPL